MKRDLKYAIVTPDGSPFHWSDFCEGWADAPITLRRGSDARHAAAFLQAKFGAAAWLPDIADPVPPNLRERIPTFVDDLDTRWHYGSPNPNDRARDRRIFRLVPDEQKWENRR